MRQSSCEITDDAAARMRAADDRQQLYWSALQVVVVDDQNALAQ
jgi:hypothetical protein